MTSDKIIVFGCGAIGSNLIHNMAHDIKGVEFYAVDRDRIEARNIQAGTQFFTREQLNMYKPMALQINIYRATGVKINPIVADINSENAVMAMLKSKGMTDIESGKILFIDCFDNASSRNLINAFAKDYELYCLHMAFSPQFTFDVQWGDAKFDDTNHKIDICEMQGARSFIQYVAGLGSSVVLDFIQKGKQLNLFGNRYSVRSADRPHLG